MTDSWAQEGRKAKKKTLEKAEHYAEVGLGTPAKKKRKTYELQYRYHPLYIERVSADRTHWKWGMVNDEWMRYRLYQDERALTTAYETTVAKACWYESHYGHPMYEYRIRPED